MVCVIGEALIDLVQHDDTGRQPPQAGTGSSGSTVYSAHPGGSPYNVALGLARLGQPARLLARLSTDAFGRQLRTHADANGVDLSLAVAAPEHATLAVVSLDADRNATYDFFLNDTADWQWTAAELDRIPADADWVHTGSLAAWTEPGAGVIEDKLARLAAESPDTVLSFDPNIRPLLLRDHAEAVGRVERLVARCQVVKASAEDLAWLYPGRPVAGVMAAWRELGPGLVVVTDGGRGAHAVAGSIAFTVDAAKVEVVDTVGAGDAFMSGLINALVRAAVLRPGPAPVEDAVRASVGEAILVAALTCTRAGANPPTAAELQAAVGEI